MVAFSKLAYGALVSAGAVALLYAFAPRPPTPKFKGCKEWVVANKRVTFAVVGSSLSFFIKTVILEWVRGVLGLPSESVLDVMLHMYEKYGSEFYLSVIPSMRVGTVFSAENLKHVLVTNFDNYQRSDHLKRASYLLLGDGIFTSKGDLWYELRKEAAPFFKHANLSGELGVMKTKVDILERVLEGFASREETVDTQKLFAQYTLDVFGEIGFGVAMNTLENRDPSCAEQRFSNAFNGAQAHIELRLRARKFSFLLSEKEYLHDIETLDSFAYNTINERLASLDDAETTSRRDLLTRVLQSRKDKNVDAEYKKRVRNFILNFLLAGRDTTAILLTWTFFYLGKHPDVVAKMIAEISDIVPDATRAERNDFLKLSYCRNVIKEVLRLNPPVPIEGRQAQNDDVLPTGQFVEKGLVIVWSNYALGRCTDIWGVDAKEFRPERWEKEAKEGHSVSNFHYLPFHAGRQRCLGEHLAQLEALVVLAHIVPKFSIVATLSDAQVIPEKKIVLCSKYGMPCKVTTR